MIKDLLISEKESVSGSLTVCTCIGMEYPWGMIGKFMGWGQEKNLCGTEFDQDVNCFSICCEKVGVTAALYGKTRKLCDEWNSRPKKTPSTVGMSARISS